MFRMASKEMSHNPNTLGDFFRGWRRKTGCAVLLVACGMMGLWMRNLREPDYFTYTRNAHHYAIHLAAGTVIWSEFTPDRCGPIDIWSREFHYSRYVIPFTLLSAYLILWKPRQNVVIPLPPETPDA